METAKKGQDVAIRIELPPYETPKMVGRHFEATDDIVSLVRKAFFFFSFAFDSEPHWRLCLFLDLEGIDQHSEGNLQGGGLEGGVGSHRQAEEDSRDHLIFFLQCTSQERKFL